MTKNFASQVIEEVTAATAVPQAAPAVEPSDRWVRQTAVELALQQHKINGGMLTVDQLLANAVKFHDYLTGENK